MYIFSFLYIFSYIYMYMYTLYIWFFSCSFGSLLRPHGLWLTRFLCTWNFPAGASSKESTYQCKIYEFDPQIGRIPWSRIYCAHIYVVDQLLTHVQVFCRLQPARLLCPWDFLGKNSGVGCHFLLQGIFLTRGLNLGLLHCRQSLYPLSHQRFIHNTCLCLMFSCLLINCLHSLPNKFQEYQSNSIL